MLRRCNNPKSISYPNYGGRGITVCKVWRKNFLVFYKWAIKNGYADNLEIDRKDVNGNYTPYNCRFITHYENSLNKRIYSTNKTGFVGVSRANKYNRFRATITVKSKKKHIGYFGTAEEAGRAYDDYIVSNNLDHIPNFKRNKKG